MKRIKHIKKQFKKLYNKQDFIINNKIKTIEIIGAQFIADENTIFGTPNIQYIQNELQWYKSMSLNIYDFPGKIPTIWKNIADNKGNIISNYGWCIWSAENYNQYQNVLNELKNNMFTRRAILIYTRPSMHYEYNQNNKNDFICTQYVQYFIRKNKLICIVNMRSNDAVFGYKNDYAWQYYIFNLLYKNLKIIYNDLKLDKIIWNASSLHIYENHFYLINEGE